MTSYAEGILNDLMLGPAIVEYLRRIDVARDNEPQQAAETETHELAR
jgi:hypothetical protein